MTTITRELVKRRAEHNDGQISTLEEIALHQQDIVKIDNLQLWCKHLKILLLQSNLISKIENLTRLRKLQYLNLALNNIEKIENLENCESLEKLDLTLNFIGDLRSCKSLDCNRKLEELYLVGNPCCKYDGYRDYVIASLPKLQSLDGITIERSERILALRKLDQLEDEISKQEIEYQVKRKSELKEEVTKVENSDMDENERVKKFWNGMSENTPETRIAISEEIRKINKSKEMKNINQEEKKEKRKISFYTKDGNRLLNINEGKIKFKLEDEENEFVLTLEVFKHLDTSKLDVDVQPTFVRALVNGKVFQLVLPEEVKTDQSSAKRVLNTRELVITMPKVTSNPDSDSPLKPPYRYFIPLLTP